MIHGRADFSRNLFLPTCYVSILSFSLQGYNPSAAIYIITKSYTSVLTFSLPFAILFLYSHIDASVLSRRFYAVLRLCPIFTLAEGHLYI